MLVFRMQITREFHVILLLKEFHKRKLKSSLYSLRAYARDIDIHPASLSQVLRSNRRLPLKSAMKIAKKLRLNAAVTMRFLESNKKKNILDQIRVSNLEDSSFLTIISEYEHCELLSLFDDLEFKCTITGVAKLLEISEDRADEVLANLKKAGLITQKGEGFVKSLCEEVSEADILRDALHEGHRESLGGIEMDSLPEVQEAIREFREKILDIAKKHDVSHMYKLGINFSNSTIGL